MELRQAPRVWARAPAAGAVQQARRADPLGARLPPLPGQSAPPSGPQHLLLLHQMPQQVPTHTEIETIPPSLPPLAMAPHGVVQSTLD